MALKIDLCRITGFREIPWADGVVQIREGQPTVTVYEDGEQHVEPPDALGNAGYAGVAISNETELDSWPVAEEISLSAAAGAQDDGLSHRPQSPDDVKIYEADGTAVDVDNAGAIASGDIAISATGAITTGANVDAGIYTFVYRYVPSVREARTLQGDLEPGGHVSSELGSTGVIVAGDVYTTEWDTESAWTAAAAARGVRMDANGRFTVADTVANAIPGVSVIQYPTADSEFLGLRFALA